MSYKYSEIKKFNRGQILGLTKSLSITRFDTDYNETNRDLVLDKIHSYGMEVGYNESHVTGEKLVFKQTRKIDKAQTEYGKDWLKDRFYKKDGKPRNGKRTEQVPDRVLDIAHKVSRFEFIGVFCSYSGFGNLDGFIPVYRAYDRKGNYFEYAHVHWGDTLFFEIEIGG